MLQAMLRRKLTRTEEEMEDLLTSNTFGLMKYLPLKLALLPFLSGAVNPLTGSHLGELLDGISQVERWKFWPYLACSQCIPCEPDVEIVLSDGDWKRVSLLVEAKYRSGKSSFASEAEDRPNDQLAREADNLTFLARADNAAHCAVIYITADAVCPVEELKQSADEYRAKRGRNPSIYWTTWRLLPTILASPALQPLEMARDLHSLLLLMELTTFCSLRGAVVAKLSWSFRRMEINWSWNVPSVAWRFNRIGRVPSRETDMESSEKSPQSPRQFRWELSHLPEVVYEWRSS